MRLVNHPSNSEAVPGSRRYKLRPEKNRRVYLRLITVTALLLMVASHATAQDFPKFEIAALYTAIPQVLGPTCHGGGASLAFNTKSWFGLVGDVGACGRPGNAIGSDTQFTYLAGARISYRRKLTPYAQLLVGGAHASGENTANGSNGDSFAMTLGAGLDLHITDRFAIRLIQPEFLRTSHNNLRIQTGVVFALGK